MPRLPSLRPLPLFLTTTLTVPLLLTTRAMSTPSNSAPSSFPTHAYTPKHSTNPYTAHDFTPQDRSPDSSFYSTPRFVTHIDDNAIGLLKEYYAGVLPRKGRISDLCSSWVSHFPRELEERAIIGKKKNEGVGDGKGDGIGKGNEDEETLEVIGLGMNAAELTANPILSTHLLRDLNTTPSIPSSLSPLSATVCVVSIDYLTQPITVLASLLQQTIPGGSVHLVISNRCFPTKAVGRWLRISEEERLQMVGDYLHFSGWKDVEVVEVCDGRGEVGGLRGFLGGRVDPLWVIRGVKGEGDDRDGKSEL